MNTTSLSHYRTTSSHLLKIASLLIIAVGCLVLAGWVLDVSLLKASNPAWGAITPNAIIPFIFAGISLLHWRIKPPTAQSRRICTLCADIVLLFSSLMLAEYIFNGNTGLDLFFFPTAGTGIGSANALPFAIPTAVDFIFIALTLLLLDCGPRWSHRLAEVCVCIAALIGLFELFIALYSIGNLNAFVDSMPMALPAALSLLIFCVALLQEIPDSSTVKTLLAPIPFR